MASAYKDLKEAEEHASKIDSKDGKLLNLDTESNKIINATNSSQYYFFYNRLVEENWDSKVLAVYKSNIIKNIKSRVTLSSSEKLDIELYFVDGRLMARVLVRDKSLDIPAYDLIK